MTKRPEQEHFSPEKAQQRTEAALRAAFKTPHKTYEESKIGKRKPKPTESPGKREPVNKSGR